MLSEATALRRLGEVQQYAEQRRQSGATFREVEQWLSIERGRSGEYPIALFFSFVALCKIHHMRDSPYARFTLCETNY